MSRFHNFYILNPSFLPFSVAIVLLWIVINFVLFMNGKSVYLDDAFCLGIGGAAIFLLALLVCNWIFLSMSESTSKFSTEVTQGVLVGFSLFILSEIMLFFSFFWAFFYFSLTPSFVLGSIWPPVGLHESVVPTLNIPLANTIILLSSGISLTLAQYASRVKNGSGYKYCLIGMGITILYAIYFIVLQALEYTSSAIDLSTSIYGAVFYMLTGLHGSHVMVGSIALLVCLYQLYYRNIDSDLKSTFFTCTIWYWHFVDVVWIFVFSLIYVWGNTLAIPVLSGYSECDFAESSMLGFQDPATYAMQTIIALHNYIMFYLVLIFIFVCVLLFGALTALDRNFLTYTSQFNWDRYDRKGGKIYPFVSKFLDLVESANSTLGLSKNSIPSFLVWAFFLIKFFLLQTRYFYITFWNHVRKYVGYMMVFSVLLVYNYFSLLNFGLIWLFYNTLYMVLNTYKMIFYDYLGYVSWKIIDLRFYRFIRRRCNITYSVYAEGAENLIAYFNTTHMKEVLGFVSDTLDLRSTRLGVFFFAYFNNTYKTLGVPQRWELNRVDRCFQAVIDGFSVDNWARTQLFAIYLDYYKARSYKKFTHYSGLEWAWSVLPVGILGLIAVPSIIALYGLDDTNAFDDCLVIKVIGHQWYWEYEISVVEEGKVITYAFDSYMLAAEDLPLNGLRLLEVDYPLYVPVGIPIKLLITSTDVLHSWAVPSLGVKVDAVPGRLNQVMFMLNREGDFYGQCSELCGVKHGFMPIHVIGYR